MDIGRWLVVSLWFCPHWSALHANTDGPYRGSHSVRCSQLLSFSGLFLEKCSPVIISGAGCLDSHLCWLLCQLWCLSSCPATPCCLPFCVLSSSYPLSSVLQLCSSGLTLMIEGSNNLHWVFSLTEEVVKALWEWTSRISWVLQDSVWCYQWSDYQASRQSPLILKGNQLLQIVKGLLRNTFTISSTTTACWFYRQLL